MAKSNKANKGKLEKLGIIRSNTLPNALLGHKITRINPLGQGVMLCPDDQNPNEIGQVLKLEKISDIEPIENFKFEVTVRETKQSLGIFDTKKEAAEFEHAHFNKKILNNEKF